MVIGKQQWGYTIESNGQEDYKYFPISFGSQCYAVSLGSTYNLQSDAYSWIENVDKEKFLIGLGHNYSPMPYPTMFYMAIGEQQWGYGTAGTITYPIQFTEIAYTAFACDIAESNENIVSVATNPPEINQIVVRPSAAQTITWLVIGKQQWGFGRGSYTEAGTLYNVWTFTYPIQFSEIIFAVEVTGCNNVKTSQGTNYYYNLELNTVDIVSHGESYVLILGKQQWGLTLPSNGYITYSLVLNSSCFSALVVYYSNKQTSSLKVDSYNLKQMRVQDSQATNEPSYEIPDKAFWLVIGIQCSGVILPTTLKKA